jgi:hypothetical protein
MNPFDTLAESNTDDNYLARVEFFLSLKEKIGSVSSVKSIAKDEVKALLKSKGVGSAKLRSALSGKMNKPKDIPGFSKKLGPKSDVKVKSTKIKSPDKVKAPKSEAKQKLVSALKRLKAGI